MSACLQAVSIYGVTGDGGDQATMLRAMGA